MNGPLSDVTVLDLTSVLSGPLSTAILADQGARVIKVESLAGDTVRVIGTMKAGVSSLFSSVNRNKESIAVNLQTSEGVDIIKRLTKKADICIQNYRPGVVEKLGIGFQDLKAVKPDIIYVSVSGVGSSGPDAGRRVYDFVIQAQAGFADVQRVGDRPDLIKMAICDKITALTTAQAVTAALYERKSTGRGQHVEVSMLEASLYFIWPDRMSRQTFVDEPELPGGEMTDMFRVLPTADGYITFICVKLGEFRAMCRALNRHDLADDPRCADTPSLYANMSDLFSEVVMEISRWKTDDLIERMNEEDVPYGIVQDGNDILADPQVHAQGILQTIEHELAGTMRMVGRSARFSNHEIGVRTPPPSLGEHGDRVLAQAGYVASEIAMFRSKGVIL